MAAVTMSAECLLKSMDQEPFACGGESLAAPGDTRRQYIEAPYAADNLPGHFRKLGKLRVK